MTGSSVRLRMCVVKRYRNSCIVCTEYRMHEQHNTQCAEYDYRMIIICMHINFVKFTKKMRSIEKLYSVFQNASNLD